MNFREQVKPRNTKKQDVLKKTKRDVLNNLYNFFERRKIVFNAFDRKIFPIEIEGTGFLDKISDHSNLNS